jgi:hypothetical protein
MVDRRQGRAYTDLAIFDAGTVRMKIAGLLRGAVIDVRIYVARSDEVIE